MYMLSFSNIEFDCKKNLNELQLYTLDVRAQYQQGEREAVANGGLGRRV